jgi:hypothetical protein
LTRPFEKEARSPSVIERVAVKTSSAATLTLIAFTSLAHAQPIQRIVPAGKTTVVFTYRPYHRWTCDGASGIVKLLDKPQHGRVAHHLRPSTIPTMSRFTHGPTGCPPNPTTGFAITYTPNPGYHGPDRFSFDVDFTENRRREIDVFTIFVE